MSVGGKSAALFFASQSQLNIQIPVDVAPGSAQLTVTVQGKGSASVTVTLASYSPGIFTLTPTGSTQSLGIFLHGKDSSSVTAQSPAQPGETLAVYAVGLGPTNPSVPTGAASPASPVATTTAQPAVTVGCQQASVILFRAGSRQRRPLPSALHPPGQRSGRKSACDAEHRRPDQQHGYFDRGRLSDSRGQRGCEWLVFLHLIAVAAPGTIVSIFGCNYGSKDGLSLFPATSFQGISATFNGVAGPLFDVAASGRSNQRRRADGAAGIGHGPRPGQEFRRSQRELQLEDVGGDPGHLSRCRPFQGIPEERGCSVCQYRLARHAFIDGHGAELTGCAGLPVAATCGQPAGAGDYIQIFVTGLGRATPGGDPNGKVLPTGSVAPADGSVLYQTVQKPAVTIGGVATPLLFSGIAPGFAGLYQINVQVPSGVAPGDDVPIVVSMPNGASDSVTIAVHP